MLNTILCSIDLTDASIPTLKWAVTLAQQLKTHLTILYTYRLLSPRSGEVVQLKKQMEAEAAERFSFLEREYLKEQGITYDFKSEVGFVSDRIEEHAKKSSLKVLVMNKNNRAQAHENLEEIVENIHVPLFLVP
jgi:nucleotide-binding universal stress UspA family protein